VPGTDFGIELGIDLLPVLGDCAPLDPDDPFELEPPELESLDESPEDELFGAAVAAASGKSTVSLYICDPSGTEPLAELLTFDPLVLLGANQIRTSTADGIAPRSCMLHESTAVPWDES
jgi:hypothetical protein